MLDSLSSETTRTRVEAVLKKLMVCSSGRASAWLKTTSTEALQPRLN